MFGLAMAPGETRARLARAVVGERSPAGTAGALVGGALSPS